MISLECIPRDGGPFTVAPGLAVTTGFTELGRYLFSRKGLDGHTLRVDEVDLDSTDDGLAWVWEPGFYAGRVQALLLDRAGHQVSEFLLDVCPDSSKLGADLYAEMIEAIRREDPALLLGDEPTSIAIGEIGDHTDINLEYSRLKIYGGLLAAAMKRISARPIRRLRQERELRTLRHVRRMDRQTVAASLHDPAALSLLCGGDQSPQAVADARFDIPRIMEHLDNAPNRALSAMVLACLARVRTVNRRLHEDAGRREDPSASTAMRERWPVRAAFLASLENRLRGFLNRAPFSDISRPEITAAGLNALSANPDYARAQRLIWKILRPGIAGTESEERLWMSPTWETYERWCFVEVVEMIRRLLPDATDSRRSPGARYDHIVYRLQTDTGQVEVHLQPRFQSWLGGNSAFKSISGTRYPDIVVTLEVQGRRSFIVLDAKYRVSSSAVLDAMSSAHIYRDSLRYAGRRPERALLLVPAGGGVPWLEDEAFQDEHGVGVVVFSPDRSDAGAIERSLGRMIAG